MARYSREVTPESLLDAYRAGIFPMAESADDPELYWVSPTRRGILPLDGFHLPRRLARTIRSDRFEVVVDRDFDGVIDGCAAPGPGRTNTWINAEIRSLYHALYCRGDVHTVAVRRDGRLVGGLYGVRIGGAFFGESMFSRETDASKVALAHLVARMRVGGFRLLDTQFITEHLAQFGTVEVPRATYHALLAEALRVRADFHRLSPPGVPVPGEVVTELLTSPETVETLRRR